MEQRRLGNTGLTVAPIGLGTVKLGRTVGLKYPRAFRLPTDDEAATLLSGAHRLGVNLLDTAPAYGTAEERLGQLLATAGVPDRSRWVLSTKVGEEILPDGSSRFDFSETATESSFNRSCDRLRTDRIDIVLIHSSGDDLAILRDNQSLRALRKLQDSGRVRAVGISVKTPEGAHEALRRGVDVLMVEHSLASPMEDDVLAAASSQGAGILLKKALASGHLDRLAPGTPSETRSPVTQAITFALNNPAVGCAIVGTTSLDHLREAVEAASLPASER